MVSFASLFFSVKRHLYPSFNLSRQYPSKAVFSSSLFRKFSRQAEDPSSHEGRLLIGFTCKQCNTRSHRTMSKLAYERGVVLAECAGCKNRHVIADHLGWFEQFGAKGGRTIEEFMKERGELVRKNADLSEMAQLIEILKEEEPTSSSSTTSPDQLPLS